MSIRLATDIGGTFTDLVAFDEESGTIQLGKSSSTPSDFARGLLDAVDLADLSLSEVDYFVHGCTVVINAITERKGVKTALVTTKGFRDVLEIGRGNRPDMYNFRYQKPVPFVPRHLRFEVLERVNFQGHVLTPLDLSSLDAIADACRTAKVEAVAICFLHAYAYPKHEQTIATRLREKLPNVAVTISSEIIREWREYERTNTTVLNGYVMPIVQGYLDRLEEAISARGLTSPLHVMQSNGGTASFQTAKKLPIYLIESGPVAGVIGAAAIGKAAGYANVISFDVGGTTAKCSLIENGEPKTTTEYKLEWTPLSPGYPIKTAVVDIVEIGAGGGSIAWFDEGEQFHVGPKSAGANPGPACYGLGGEAPTVTDAKLVAGVINADNFLGGQQTIYPALAHHALEPVAAKMGTTVEAAANGIIRMANANMTEALKLISVQKGYDPRDFALVAFGGDGAMHAAALAKELHIERVIVPPHPGHFSAWGMLVTLPRVDLVRTSVHRSSSISVNELTAQFNALEEEARGRLSQDSYRESEGTIFLQRRADLRYHGQEHTVSVPVGLEIEHVDQIVSDFHVAHERMYTFQLPDTPVEFVNFHVTGFLQARTPAIQKVDRAGSIDTPQPKMREVDFDVDGVHKTLIYHRRQLHPGFVAEGPIIVEEPASTTLIHPKQKLEVDSFGNLVIGI